MNSNHHFDRFLYTIILTEMHTPSWVFIAAFGIVAMVAEV